MGGNAMHMNPEPNAAMRSGKPTYWRTYDEAVAGEPVDAFVHREFPSQAGALLDPFSRRNFLRVMGASMMLGGLSGCPRQPEEKIVPYVVPPEEGIPGKFLYFATAMPLGGYGLGLVASSYEGRPTKVDGLREHPSSLGATGIHAQASILDLYDPDRLDTVTHLGNISTWNRFVADLARALEAVNGVEGEGLYLLTGTVTSPTLGEQLKALLNAHPKARWHQWEPAGRDNVRAGARLAFGEHVDTVYDFTKAEVILSLDSNFLVEGPGHVRYAMDFAEARDVEKTRNRMSRLYVAESSPTLTGAKADNAVSLRYCDVEAFARLVAQELGVPGFEESVNHGNAVPDAWVKAVAADLAEHLGKGVVLAGDHQSAVVHAIAHAINLHLGNEAGPVSYVEPVEVNPTSQRESLESLVADLVGDKVKILVVIGGNPVYDAPADWDLEKAIARAALRVHLTDAANETSRLCHWVIPEAHYLESWSDVRGHDGTISIIQPLIAPLYNGRTAHELLKAMEGVTTPRGHDILREAWKGRHGGDGFETFWTSALAAGVVPGTASPRKAVSLQPNLPEQSVPPKRGALLDIVFRTDPNVLDGRFANNAWLQELPKPLTKLTWDNAVHIHPKTAERFKVRHEDVVKLEFQGRRVFAPVMIQFGHPEDVVTLHLGYGRSHCGRVGKGLGFNAYTLRASESQWFGTGAHLNATGDEYTLARTEEHYHIEQSLIEQGEKAEDRQLIREASLSYYAEHPDFAQHSLHHSPAPQITLYQPSEKAWDGHRWGMTIDLNRCNGCNVCVLACQAENNIAVVGKEEVAKGREMHWIRVDRYYRGDFYGAVETVHQPIPCMQCENAPCEPVCPVGATSHSKEGLNDMVYNRCVGTRYCSNNCPYKVRRFNFFKYSDHTTPQLKMMRNPNVTVRSRGVMEKCTYCVQRINAARIEEKRSGRPVADGEVVTACQAACPSRAIVFGDLADASSRVKTLSESLRNYALLGDVGTRPRTTFLAQIRNPSPALGAAHEGPAHPETVHG